MDIREIETTLCDGRKFEVAPDIVGDFTSIKFPDNTFKMVVFGPPHLLRNTGKSKFADMYGSLSEKAAPTGYQQIKYGALYSDWKDMPRGSYRKYRIRSYDANDLYSDWKESASVYRALSATVPSILSPIGGYYETAPALSWSASTAPDNNLAGYKVQISTDGGTTWDDVITTTELSIACAGFETEERGTLFLFRVCAYTMTNATSDWAVSQAFGKNTLPTAPSVLAPSGSPTVYGTGAWIVISCDEKSNGIS